MDKGLALRSQVFDEILFGLGAKLYQSSSSSAWLNTTIALLCPKSEKDTKSITNHSFALGFGLALITSLKAVYTAIYAQMS